MTGAGSRGDAPSQQKEVPMSRAKGKGTDPLIVGGWMLGHRGGIFYTACCIEEPYFHGTAKLSFTSILANLSLTYFKKKKNAY